MNMDSFNWIRLAEQQWLDNARSGYIVVQGEADDAYCLTVRSLVDRWLALPMSTPLEIVVNVLECESGGPSSFYLGQAIERLGCRTEVRYSAGSAGLFIFMGGAERLAHPGARFTFHGNLYRWMKSGASDEERAEWFTSRTNKPYDFWFEQCKIDGVLTFGVEEALEWGVITGVIQEESR